MPVPEVFVNHASDVPNETQMIMHFKFDTMHPLKQRS